MAMLRRVLAPSGVVLLGFPIWMVAGPAWAASGSAGAGAFVGITLVLLVIGVTIGSWREMFQDLGHGGVTVALWVFMLATGQMGGLFALMILGWAGYLHHDDLLRRYYRLIPHPAQELYDRALRSGRPMDLEAFSEAVRQFDNASLSERRARAQQIDLLNAQLAGTARQVGAKETAILDAERTETKRDSELLRAQAAALEAAIAHERAAARYEELERTRRT